MIGEPLQQERCCKCDVTFGMTVTFYEQRRKDKDWFYCPNGHPQHYTKSQADLLREELDRKAAELAQARVSASAARENEAKAIIRAESAKRAAKRANQELKKLKEPKP